ncbi:MAG: hypothetical protein P8X95_01495 [Anaerolineales bacterium]
MPPRQLDEEAYWFCGQEIFGAAALIVIALTRARLSYDPEVMPN